MHRSPAVVIVQQVPEQCTVCSFSCIEEVSAVLCNILTLLEHFTIDLIAVELLIVDINAKTSLSLLLLTKHFRDTEHDSFAAVLPKTFIA